MGPITRKLSALLTSITTGRSVEYRALVTPVYAERKVSVA